MNSLETNDQNQYNRTREIDFPTHFTSFSISGAYITQNATLLLFSYTPQYTLMWNWLIELPFKAFSIH